MPSGVCGRKRPHPQDKLALAERLQIGYWAMDLLWRSYRIIRGEHVHTELVNEVRRTHPSFAESDETLNYLRNTEAPIQSYRREPVRIAGDDLGSMGSIRHRHS